MRFILTLILLSACSDTGRARFNALGSSAHVVCYSGGEVIYDGYSKGRVYSPENSDGWSFKDKDSGMLIEVSGDCILSVETLF